MHVDDPIGKPAVLTGNRLYGSTGHGSNCRKPGNCAGYSAGPWRRAQNQSPLTATRLIGKISMRGGAGTSFWSCNRIAITWQPQHLLKWTRQFCVREKSHSRWLSLRGAGHDACAAILSRRSPMNTLPCSKCQNEMILRGSLMLALGVTRKLWPLESPHLGTTGTTSEFD